MSAQTFKTIYFPPERTRSGRATRVSISLPGGSQNRGFSQNFQERIRTISSREFRTLLGDPFLEDLEQNAHTQSRTFTNYCLHALWDKLMHTSGTAVCIGEQLPLEFPATSPSGPGPFGSTFRESKRRAIHRWYPYVEGFSAEYVRSILHTLTKRPTAIYDPFGGAGTTQLEASLYGFSSFFSEINPFLAFVANTKVNAVSWGRKNLREVEETCNRYIRTLRSKRFKSFASGISLDPYYNAFPARDFFEERHLRQLLAALQLAHEVGDGCEPIRALLTLAVACKTVDSSKMTRRADLRRRRSDEYKTRVVDVVEFVSTKVEEMIHDIRSLDDALVTTRQISMDARTLPEGYHESFDLCLTSPPYLNGTNYFRNTKLELWLLGYIKSEAELKTFYRESIACGINNVSRDRPRPLDFSGVEKVAKRLDYNADDKRIPALVRMYFSDMFDVLTAVQKSLKKGARLIIDIGDSKFYGVHVPTDELLIEVANEAGFVHNSSRMLARRRSLDKSWLRQTEIVFEKPRNLGKLRLNCDSYDRRNFRSIKHPILRLIADFVKNAPYKNDPFSRRSWGHPLHSLCSYQGKLKPSVAHWLIKLFTTPEMSVLDPLGGVGTIAFEACLQGRKAISNDLNPLAASIARGKLNPPSMDEALGALENLGFALNAIEIGKRDQEEAEFGLNARVKDYFHQKTLIEVLKARKFYLNEGSFSRADAFVKACLLHILHGNRPYALSRRSHPMTPFHPSGPFEYRPLIQRLEDRIKRLLATPLQTEFKEGVSLNCDFRELPEIIGDPVDTIITSPPFIGMRFDRPNWMRLWFCGWRLEDFHETRDRFLERQQMTSLDVYEEFFRICAALLGRCGLLILHVGGSGQYDMISEMTQFAHGTFNLLARVDEDVKGLDKHGIKDKGLTSAHHFLFFQKSVD